MSHFTVCTLIRRGALPLALLCALGSPNAAASTAGLCHYLTTTLIQNVTGHPLSLSSQTATGSFSIQPNIPNSWTLATGGVTGFSQTWGNSSQSDMGGKLTFKINDGQTNPQFRIDYWSGVGASPGTVSSDLISAAQEQTLDKAKELGEDAAKDALEIEVPPPADAVIAALKFVKFIVGIAKDIADAFQALGYLNIYDSNGNDFAGVANVSVDTNQAETVAIPGQGGSYYNGYVVSAISINNGCTNSWNVVVTNYCAYVCGYAAANNTALADSGCASSAYCSSSASSASAAKSLFATH